MGCGRLKISQPKEFQMRNVTVIGLTIGLIATTNEVFAQAVQQQQLPPKVESTQPAEQKPDTAQNRYTKERLTQEDAFKEKLNPQMQVVFNNMSPEGKALAMMMATQNGEDYNMAVKRAVQKMANKRMNMPMSPQ